MSIVASAALAAAALVVAPPPPGRRLTRPRRVRRSCWPAALSAVLVASAVALLVSPAAAGTAVAAAAAVSARGRRRARIRSRNREGRELAAALEVLVGELRVGAHPVQAFAAAAAESGGPVGSALRAVAGRARLGADVTAGLRAVAESSAVPLYWERIAVCWQLAAEHGLAMSALMRAAHRDIVDRQRFSDRVEAGTAGARATAAILAGLPLVGIALGQLIGANPLRFLFSGSGAWLLMAGAVLIVVGMGWSDRIIGGLAR